MIFKIVVHLKDRHVFMWQSLVILNDFDTLSLKQIFWKMKTIFKKLEYFFLAVRRLKTAIFLQKTALTEANVKTNRMGSSKLNYHKEGVFLVATIFFWKSCFSIRTSYKELIWCANYQNVHFHTFRKRLSFTWGYFFPVSILKHS